MKTYKTVLGDTFDKIALEQLGSEYLFPLLLEANQKYRDTVVFSSGVVLSIPDVSLDENQGVPDWLIDDDDGTENLDNDSLQEFSDEADS